MVAKAKGGSFDNVQPALDFFKKLKAAGNFINVNPTAATIASGQTQVVIDWTYNQVGAAKKFAAVGKTWKVFIPKGVAIGSFYNVAISKWAPHPACARLWVEYVMSPYAQNIWAAEGAAPILWPWLLKTNQATTAGKAASGTGREFASSATVAQVTAARAILKTAWPAAVGTN
jgi:putative spermidine/putrescine transport system substrate-binding protein